jgi:hypothetical protein
VGEGGIFYILIEVLLILYQRGYRTVYLSKIHRPIY